MRTLFIDCTRGIATDMFCGALLGLYDNKHEILQYMQDKLPKNILLTAESAKSYDRTGLLFKIKCEQFNEKNKHGTKYEEVKDFILAAHFSTTVKNSALSVYDLIADAECKVHGKSKETVHFHEVGQVRAVAGVLCACSLVESVEQCLDIEKMVFSSVNAGCGKTMCEHGQVDVPAPATKIILGSEVPFYSDGTAGELCTPCGSALIRFFAREYGKSAEEFGDTIKQSTGLGTRDIGVGNGVVAVLCER